MEVEKLKLDLARSGVPSDVETLRRGMMLIDREALVNENSRKYLRGDEFLMENPNKKVKKSKRRDSVNRRTGKSSTKKATSKGRSRKKSTKRAASSGESAYDDG